mmetsp:Transcript_6707/g.11072  ORF Transcript_6707/g.11072 Transcript_6707/m.11072 type:complete len:232 (-) Transcript_6707:902-1597(-)
MVVEGMVTVLMLLMALEEARVTQMVAMEMEVAVTEMVVTEMVMVVEGMVTVLMLLMAVEAVGMVVAEIVMVAEAVAEMTTTEVMEAAVAAVMMGTVATVMVVAAVMVVIVATMAIATRATRTWTATLTPRMIELQQKQSILSNFGMALSQHRTIRVGCQFWRIRSMMLQSVVWRTVLDISQDVSCGCENGDWGSWELLQRLMMRFAKMSDCLVLTQIQIKNAMSLKGAFKL